MQKIIDRHPKPHAKYVVIRDSILFTATPCYGMHAPWWVVKTMEGEADPIDIQPEDQWMKLETFIALAKEREVI